jgi:huntingtin interacting protein 1
MILEMGKLWGHLNDGYGLSIKEYSKLLVTKLNFHDRNPRFPGSNYDLFARLTLFYDNALF